MGRLRIQPLLNDKIWGARFKLPQNDRYKTSSTPWIFVNSNIIIENWGNNIKYNQIDTAFADMCFSKTVITHSVY